MKNILVITNNDNIWLKPAWSKLLELKPKFLNFNFVTLPEKKIYNKNPIFYYLSNFGLKNVILLSIFSIIRLFKNFRKNKITFNKTTTLNLKFLDVKLLKDKIKEFNPDLIFITCSYIIPKELIEFDSNLPWFNKHASILPSSKGVFPYIYNQINENKQGLSFHYVTESIDSGDIVLIKEIKDSGSMVDFYIEIYDNFDQHFVEFYKNFEKNIKSKQRPGGSYFSYPNKIDMKKFYKKGGKVIKFKDIFNA